MCSEGVIDLDFRENGRWVVADFETDSGDDPGFEERSCTAGAGRG